MLKKLLIPLLAVLVLITPPFTYAQSDFGKTYYYPEIRTKIKVNPDSTLDIEETQTYTFNGSFHQGWRVIPKYRFDSLTDVSVIDGQTLKPLIHSPSKLDKLDPSSWGKYTAYYSGGSENIEWYYNLADTTHSWILKYKIHGAIEFNRNSDRLYWNIFTSYTVPVQSAKVEIDLPGEPTSVYAYRTYNQPISQQTSLSQVSFSSDNFQANESFTVDVSFPKGLVSQGAYFRDYIKTYFGYIWAILIFIGSVTTAAVLWLIREKFARGRGTVVPQYEPPQKLPPAIAEVILKERLTDKGLSATIIDLAVRGYIKIAEDKAKDFMQYLVPGGLILIVVVLVFFLGYSNILGKLTFVAFLVLVFLQLALRFPIWRVGKDYTLTLNKSYKSEPKIKLRDFEKDYLDLLFPLYPVQDSFSTKELRKGDVGKKRVFHESLVEIRNKLYEETQTDTGAYAVDLKSDNKEVSYWVIIIIALFALFYIQNAAHIALNQWEVLIVSTIACLGGLWVYYKYEARLNKAGLILKEDWLGFKMYLEAAERYRLQNLTPDKFEKYLPYAIIFGVEKKWAKAFEKLSLPTPRWYGGAGYYGGYGGTSSGGSSFSPSVFSASFASSFSSSFASSGASGGSGGGGGGAGGGGGGGGGGAS